MPDPRPIGSVRVERRAAEEARHQLQGALGPGVVLAEVGEVDAAEVAALAGAVGRIELETDLGARVHHPQGRRLIAGVGVGVH